MKKLIFAAAVILLLVLFAWIFRPFTPRAGSPSTDPAADAPRARTADMFTIAQQFFKTLPETTDASKLRSHLEELRRSLRTMPHADAIRALREFLTSGTDASTSLRFLPGPGGFLLEAPTLRVFALDVLEELDPDEAAAISRKILHERKSQDEWAIALRNARETVSDPIALLENALTHTPWIEAPTPGLLHTLDLIAHEGDTRLLPRLQQLRTSVSSPWYKASTVSLNRLASHHPLATQQYINTHPNWLADTPLVRADLFASADLSDPAQVHQIEQRLADPAVSFEEKEKILLILLSPGTFINDGLFTRPNPMLSEEQLEQRNTRLQSLTDQWLKTFPDLNPVLQEVREILAESD